MKKIALRGNAIATFIFTLSAILRRQNEFATAILEEPVSNLQFCCALVVLTLGPAAVFVDFGCPLVNIFLVALAYIFTNPLIEKHGNKED